MRAQKGSDEALIRGRRLARPHANFQCFVTGELSMSDKTRLGQSDACSRPEKHRLRPGATGLVRSLNNLAQAAACAAVGTDGQTSHKKAKRR
jgi:hypothetical protein